MMPGSGPGGAGGIVTQTQVEALPGAESLAACLCVLLSSFNLSH